MSLNTAVIRLLVEKGLSAQDILEISEAMEGTSARSANADRQARWREKRRAAKDRAERYSVDVTDNVTDNALLPPNDIYSNPPVSSDDDTARGARKNRNTPIAKPEDVPDQIWTDFLAHRKAKKAPVTPTVIDGIAQEATKAGWTLAAALAETVARGWQGFKADWVAEKPRGSPQQAAQGSVDPLIASILRKKSGVSA